MSIVTWNKIPAPPAPTGINQFPAAPPIIQVAQTKLPDQKKQLTDIIIIEQVHCDQILTVTAQWKKVLSCTASPSTPFNQTDSVTTGTSTTDTITKSFSASLGVAASLGSIGASMSETFSHSITMSKSKTISQQFSVTPTKEEISAIWWQLVYTYTIKGKVKLLMEGKASDETPFTTTISNADETFISTVYPNSANLKTSGFEKFMKEASVF